MDSSEKYFLIDKKVTQSPSHFRDFLWQLMSGATATLQIGEELLTLENEQTTSPWYHGWVTLRPLYSRLLIEQVITLNVFKYIHLGQKFKPLLICH